MSWDLNQQQWRPHVVIRGGTLIFEDFIVTSDAEGLRFAPWDKHHVCDSWQDRDLYGIMVRFIALRQKQTRERAMERSYSLELAVDMKELNRTRQNVNIKCI